MQIIARSFLTLVLLAGLLPPLTAAQAAGPNCDAAAEGTILYNKTHKLVQFCNGTQWIGLTAKIGGAGDTLSDLTCQNGEIAKWNGTTWACAEDSGGLAALQGTDDPGACTLAKDGLIRYRTGGNPKWEYCDGGTTNWLPFRLPQCADDDTGECTLSALRSSSDPQFSASNIRCGSKLLGVTGTYGSGSSAAFTWADATNANPSTLTTTGTVSISGIASGCPAQVEVSGQGSPQVSIAGGAWGSGGAIANGQTLAVRLTSSGTFGATNTANVLIGSTSDAWSVITRAAINCTAQSKTWLTHCTATVSAANNGANGTATIADPGGCGTAYFGSGTFSCADGAFTYASGTCTQQTACDTTPNAFTFSDVTGANPGTLTASSSVTISGINTATAVSTTGGAEFRINGGGWATSGNITSGQTLEVRLTSSASYSTAVSTTVTVGTVTDTWSVTTRAADTAPDAFALTDLTGVNPSTLSTSTAITPAGYEAGASVSVTGSGSPQISINGGAWGTSGTISPGQTIAVRLTSSASFSTALTATVTVGGVSDSWSVTTRAANSCTAASNTWLANCTTTVSAAAHGANGTGTITDPGGCGTAYYGSGTFTCSDGTFTYSSGTCTQQTACDTTPNAFTFTDVTGANPSTLTASSSVAISGINTAASVSATGGAEFRINGASWVTSGSIANGQTLEARLTSSASFSTAVSTTITVGTVTDIWSVTTRAADTAPDAFNFTDLTGVNASTLSTSTAITPTGYEAGTAVSVTGSGSPQISINGGAWTASGTITPGQTIAVRLTSSASFSTALTATVTIGGVSDTWSVTTRAADTVPAAFAFTDLSGVNPSTLSTSTAITPTGYEAGTAVSVTGSGSPQISINGGAWTTSGTITPGQTIAVRLTSSASFSTALTATVTIGGVTDSWSVTTRAPNTCTSQGKTWLTNCTATVSAAAHGANGTATITNPGGCGTAWYGSGTFACSDGTFTYSSGTCTQQTACDTTPNAFTFTDVTGAALATLTTSSTITISGINTGTSVSVSGGGSPQISINGGAWTTSGTITNGQTLAVRLTSSSSGTTALSATVTVGGVSDAWSVTTAAASGCVTNANCSSGGKCVGGFCWYQTSGYTESCNSYCASRGGCSTAGTVNFAGSAGTQANCSNVLKAFYGASMAAANYGNPGWGGWGCGAGSDAYSGGTYGIWASSPATTCATTNQAAIDSYGGYGGAARVCACNN